MKNIEKYKSLLETGEVDALLLTSEYNRLYAAQYSIAEGVAVVTKEGAYYFTDSRYSGAQVFYAGTEGSAQLAKLLQERLVSTLNPGSNRKCKKSDGVYLMEHIDCTGVLIECGFLSNAEEEAKLSCSTYQKKLCCVIAATVSQYLSNT